MTKVIQSVRGMHDGLPDQSNTWKWLQAQLYQMAHSYGYQQIRLPIVEHTQLFKRSLGEDTDIIEKEMYTFLDRNEDLLTLRPEGTAVCIRAAIQHQLLSHTYSRLFYEGPMFRRERPQKGRYRQFEQFGVEAFGMHDLSIDIEMLLMTHRLWQNLGLNEWLTLSINCLGNQAERKAYQAALVDYFQQYFNELDPDSQRRLHANPLRILDSKHPSVQALVANAPVLGSYLQPHTLARFEACLQALDEAGIAYRHNPHLVRGLDYYNDLVFEWETAALGSQGTLCAGGRYDSLVAALGGPDCPAIGFAVGMDRVMALLQTIEQMKAPDNPEVVVLSMDMPSRMMAVQVAERLRSVWPTCMVWVNGGTMNIKKQLKLADKLQAVVAIIIGPEEYKNQLVTVRPLLVEEPQQQVCPEDLAKAIEPYI